MHTTKLVVPDISCDHCKTSIESATQALSGVSSSEVDIPSKTVTLSFQPADVDWRQSSLPSRNRATK